MKLLLPLVVLMLVGFGCTKPSPTQTPAPASQSTATGTPNTGTSATANPALPVIDDTWQTYTSRGGDFSFQWPTKGRYAPTWEVSMPATDPCNTREKFMTKEGVTFCHSMTAINPPTGGDYPYTGTMTLEDAYSTAYKDKFLVITFTKKDALGIDETTYRAHLDQIMGTFVMKGE